MEAREQIEKFKEFFEKNYLTSLNKTIREQKKSFNFDFRDFEIEEPELAEELLKEPEEVIKAAELSLEDLNIPEKDLRIRVYNLPKAAQIKIRNIRSVDLGRFLSFDGIVRQSSDVRPQVTNAKFECPSCGNTLSILQIDQKFKEPSRCTCGRRGSFRMISKDLVDAQRLVLEEPPEALEGGEQPKRLSVFLKEDLVEPTMERKTTPGSKIKVTGVVKEVPIQLKTGAQSIRYDIAADAIHVEPIEQTYEDIEITEEDKEKIYDLAKDPALFERLINSIAPSVYGYEDTKEALILQLVGGVKRERPDGTKLRGDVHILLVGDPGAAKSTMLTFMEKAAPKARYVAGRSSSGAGITASVVKDEFLRGWALEAGAVVLANKGLLLIDEMDKMTVEDTSALHEAMAQQQVTISKANIQATLRAETSILAAANPKLGRFDPFQPIGQQIDLPPALINRFDLIFPVRDIPSREVDEKIALHILEQDFKGKSPEIPSDFLKKYVSYCKINITPKLTKQAILEIKNFYVGLRNSGGPNEGKIKPIPISARQLESIIRLAEASARVRLSETVTQADAQRAIKLVTYCLTQVGIDPETGQIDIDRISTGITANVRSRISVIREIIDHLEKKVGKSIPIEDIIAEAGEKGLSESQVEEVIERFKREGYIFEPKRGQLSKL